MEWPTDRFEGKKVLVVGMARSGMAVAEFLLARGALVTVSDRRHRSELEAETRKLESMGIRCEVGGHRLDTFLDADCLVVSPGVPLSLPPIREAALRGGVVLSEIELASRFLRGTIVGITGSNGKTTTTALVGAILRAAGFRTQVGGNIGVPLTSLIDSSDSESVNVVELSSFQLEAVPSFRAHVAVILNVTPDHMDRYDSLEAYAGAKLNLLRNQTAADFAVLNRDDGMLQRFTDPSPAARFWFSTKSPVEQGCYLDGDALFFSRRSHREPVLKISSVRIKGRHNLENVAAGVTVARLLGASGQPIREAIESFRGVSHRLEWVRELQGIAFYNDSKATNLASARVALEAFERRLVLILGGRDKGGDFSALKSLVGRQVRGVVLLGEASPKIQAQLRGTVPMKRASSMDEAVRLAYRQANPGDVVLLAPACSSFDMFKDYEDRGNVFKEAVGRLH